MQWETANRWLDELTNGIGHPEHFRKFRMQITLCKHVPLTDAEIERLPSYWHDRPGQSLAGGPVESLASLGLPAGLLSTQPCERPGHKMLTNELGLSEDPDCWLPVDCGECVTCGARSKLVASLTTGGA